MNKRNKRESYSKDNSKSYLTKLKHMPLWQIVTKVMPIAFVIMATLTFSACLKKIVIDFSKLGGDGAGDGGDTAACAKPAAGDKKFISRWNLSKISNLVDNKGAPIITDTGPNKIKLPLVTGGTYNFTVDWGDGKTSTITAWNSSEAIHTYTSTGEYTVTITGTIEGWQFGNNRSSLKSARNGDSDAAKLLEISCFGPLSLGNTAGFQFFGAENLTITAPDAPALWNTKNMIAAFANAIAFNTDISGWDVSSVTNMVGMFSAATAFNNGGAILNWDDKLANVNHMGAMFTGATSFNQPLNSWDVSSVTNMVGMFSDATAFNQPIGSWDVSSVETMYLMFWRATSFNQPLNSWNAPLVTPNSGYNSSSGCGDMFKDSGMASANANDPRYPTTFGSHNGVVCNPTIK